MNYRTDTVSSKTWLRARPHFFLKAYVEAYVSTASASERTPLRPDVFGGLKKPGPMSPIIISDKTDRDLGTELAAWDCLSDEALSNFEDQLG
jgi:hypothetical protein